MLVCVLTYVHNNSVVNFRTEPKIGENVSGLDKIKMEDQPGINSHITIYLRNHNLSQTKQGPSSDSIQKKYKHTIALVVQYLSNKL